MNDETNREDEEFRAWYKSELDRVVQKMIEARAVTGVAIDATPVWAVPNQILIAKVWSAAQKSQFIWTISGENIIDDHVAGAVATSPRDVAKHFALKWQADAERIFRVAEKQANDANKARMSTQANKLVRDAEGLYDLAARDDIWS